jgi:uncharacterized phosphatase
MSQTKLPRKDFYFIRHGETDVNADPHHKRVDYDLPLNERGRAQAFSLREAIASLCFKSVCFSPIQRAKETKEILVERLLINHIEIQELSECKADTWTKMVKLEVEERSPFYEDVDHYLSRTLQGLCTALTHDAPTLIVAHGGTHWAICYSLMIEQHPWRIGNCSLVHFQPVGEAEWKAEII